MRLTVAEWLGTAILLSLCSFGGATPRDTSTLTARTQLRTIRRLSHTAFAPTRPFRGVSSGTPTHLAGRIRLAIRLASGCTLTRKPRRPTHTISKEALHSELRRA